VCITSLAIDLGRPGAESLTDPSDEYVWLCEAQALRGPGCLAGGFDLSADMRMILEQLN
jgi:hypothetical protein